ncbi:DUF1254 domain-containing protein [Paraburkholderia acidiphila]|uniref:DUF1214 domain-containing protein n=1 Tax=Paraburkholderia acidiphila TaxID=2571747 RepID=A0A7Z2JBI5_9BURK|nr:DUF1254 domain-containing protein [Paraburkholderia acidiphila]QGZ58566.1 DUF1214 domain-containing protein [Paraburkholderia acidiphila]
MTISERTISLALLFGAAVWSGAVQPVCEAGAVETATLASSVAPGPDRQEMLTEQYARLVARDAWFWAWPMVNLYNRRLAFKRAPEPGLIGGVLPFAPLNRLAMLGDYIEPDQRWVACPNQDVVYGAGILALDQEPVVIQVPDFGTRFWVYQLADIRTDDFAGLGAMYGTRPGFYMVVGPNWHGAVPHGINGVLRARSSTAMVIPRIFQADTPEDRMAVAALTQDIDVYPLSEYDGRMKHHDWSTLRKFARPAGSGQGETRWVRPETFFDELPAVLADAPALPGEEARYAQVLAVIAAAKSNPAMKAAMIDEASKADRELVDPLLQFRNWGVPLPFHWTTVHNGARFGTDYFTRTAVAKSNIMVNAPNETSYFYQDLDASGVRLDGSNRYTITFAKGQLPPTRGFWSLTLYDEHHFFAPNALKRYALGTRNQQMVYGDDGSLTIYIQADSPGADKEANWLPAPAGAPFSLMLRNYWPTGAAADNPWTPPALARAQ